MGKGGFYEGFEWTLKQDGYFTDISQLRVPVMCPSKALFVATDAAIFVFPFPPRRPDKSRPAYVYGKRGFNEGFEWTLKQDRYFTDI